MHNQYQAPKRNLNNRTLKPNDNYYKCWLMVGYMNDRAELIKWLQRTSYTEGSLIRSIVKQRLNEITGRLRELYRECA